MNSIQSPSYWKRILSLCILSVALVLTACSGEQAAKAPVVRPVKALRVSDASVFQQRWFPGRAKATEEVELSFRVSGRLLELPINIGDKIEKGGLIARLDPATFRAEVDRRSAEVAKAEADAENAKLQLERQLALAEKGWVAQARVDRYVANEKAAAASVKATKAALEQAKLDLEYTTLQAPFSGIVVAKYVENFQDVRAKEPIARLVNASRIEIIINIPETLISLSSQVRDIVVVFDALPDLRIPATLKEIGTEASETTRTYPVTLIMDQPEGAEILPGMAGRVQAERIIGLEEVGSTVIVPPSALVAATDGKSAIWVINEGDMTVSKRDVRTGSLDARGVRISEGLKPGEWVVIAGVNSLKIGQKVSILKE